MCTYHDIRFKLVQDIMIAQKGVPAVGGIQVVDFKDIIGTYGRDGTNTILSGITINTLNQYSMPGFAFYPKPIGASVGNESLEGSRTIER